MFGEDDDLTFRAVGGGHRIRLENRRQLLPLLVGPRGTDRGGEFFEGVELADLIP